MVMATSPRAMALIPAGLALVLVILGLVFFLIARHEEKRAVAMRTWPSTPVTITSCGVTTFRNSGETQDRDQLVTSYAWTVNGRRYESTASEYLGWSSPANQSAVHHKAGDTVTGIYNPEDPDDMATGSGESEGTPLFLRLGPWLLFAASLPFWLLARKVARPAKS